MIVVKDCYEYVIIMGLFLEDKNEQSNAPCTWHKRQSSVTLFVIILLCSGFPLRGYLCFSLK